MKTFSLSLLLSLSLATVVLAQTPPASGELLNIGEADPGALKTENDATVSAPKESGEILLPSLRAIEK
jgi:hypothetical protein